MQEGEISMQEQPTEQSERSEQPTKRHSSGRGGLITGWILVIVGILFLLNNFYILDFGRFWPVLLIAIGIILLVGRSPRERGE
jgi:hypothetical protein